MSLIPADGRADRPRAVLSRTRILPTLLVLLCGLFLVLPGPARAAVPAAWPFGTLQIGMRDDEHGAVTADMGISPRAAIGSPR